MSLATLWALIPSLLAVLCSIGLEYRRVQIDLDNFDGNAMDGRTFRQFHPSSVADAMCMTGIFLTLTLLIAPIPITKNDSGAFLWGQCACLIFALALQLIVLFIALSYQDKLKYLAIRKKNVRRQGILKTSLWVFGIASLLPTYFLIQFSPLFSRIATEQFASSQILRSLNGNATEAKGDTPKTETERESAN